MPNSAPNVAFWPDTPESLSQVLHLQSADKLKCHGTTRKEEGCKRDISRVNKASIDRLLDSIVAQRNSANARALLTEVAQLVVCQRDHQNQGPVLLAQWQKALKDAEARHAQKLASEEDSTQPDSPAIKKEEEESPTPTRIRAPPRPTPVAVKKEERPSKTHTLSQLDPVPSAENVKVPKRENSEDSASSSTQSTTELTPRKAHTSHTFEPFGKLKTTVQRNQCIKDKIRNPLSSREMPKPNGAPGWVYMYTLPDNLSSNIKIGYAANVQDRMRRIQHACGYKPEVVDKFSMPLYVKVERLVHAQLWNKRLREPGCPKCGKRHNEWFSVDCAEASRVVGMWAAWSRLEPYDEFGHLKTKWVMRLEEVDLEDPECWQEFVKELEQGQEVA